MLKEGSFAHAGMQSKCMVICQEDWQQVQYCALSSRGVGKPDVHRKSEGGERTS